MACLLVSSATLRAADPTTTLWFDRPATSFHESLPLGNGRLGAMVFGGTVSVMEAMRDVGVKRVVLASSGAALIRPDDAASAQRSPTTSCTVVRNRRRCLRQYSFV